MGEDSRPTGARIADAIDRLRDRGIAIEESTQAGTTIYLVARPAYRAKVIVNPARWLGLDFDLLGQDGSRVLSYSVDTDLYNISLKKYRWFAAEIETDIVLLLEALAQGTVLVDTVSPRASMIAPSSGGPVLVRRRRFGMSWAPYGGDVSSALPSGFRTVGP